MASGLGLQLSLQENARGHRFSPDHTGNDPRGRSSDRDLVPMMAGLERRLRMRCLLGVPIFLVLSYLPLHAQEQAHRPQFWLEIGQGIVCDTPEQVQRFVGLRGDGMEVSVALRTVNKESRGSTACDIALIAFTDSKPIAARVIQGKLAAIVQITVHAVGNGETWRTTPAHARYTVGLEEGQII
jgi:hypothetical protein